MLHLGPVVAGDARRNGRVGHQLVDPRRLQDVRCVLLQRLVVAHHAVVYLAWRAQVCVRHPVDDVLPKLTVHAAAPFHITQVSDKVLEVEARGGQVAVAVALAVLTDDGRRDVMLVPRLEARVLHELVLECRYQALEGISYNEKLEVSVQSVGKHKRLSEMTSLQDENQCSNPSTTCE